MYKGNDGKPAGAEVSAEAEMPRGEETVENVSPQIFRSIQDDGGIVGEKL